MNIHYFQHVPYEGLGNIESWAYKPGNKVTATRFFEDHRFPFIDLFDMLIIMGGPMGANDDNNFSWMREEKKMIERAIQKGKIVIGICLGAQLIADVLGARVYKNREAEIGWYPIHITPAAQTVFPDMFEEKMTVLHWHGDTFDLPGQATHLAYSEVCTQQGFLYRKNVLGLQFHLEATPALVKQFVESDAEALGKGNFVQTAEQILNAPAAQYIKNNFLLTNLLDKMCTGNIVSA